MKGIPGKPEISFLKDFFSRIKINYFNNSGSISLYLYANSINDIPYNFGFNEIIFPIGFICSIDFNSKNNCFGMDFVILIINREKKIAVLVIITIGIPSICSNVSRFLA